MDLNDKQKIFIERKLQSLKMSKFRSGFSLGKKEIEYIKNKGMETIFEHAEEFVRKRLGCANILNDGRQTPMRGHPVFIAQHATATCCRGCLFKWHKIEENRELNEHEIRFIVALIMEWIKREYRKVNDEL